MIKPDFSLLKGAVALLFILVIGGCSPETPPPEATLRWQLTDSLVVDGKLSRDGEISALLLADNRIVIWQNAKQLRKAEWAGQSVLPDTRVLSLSMDGDHLLSANKTAIQLWQAGNPESTGSLDFSRQLGDAQITEIVFIRPPYEFAVGTSGGDIIFADTKQDRYLLNHGHTAEVVKLAVTEGQRFLFSGGNDGAVIKWDLYTHTAVITKTFPYRITSLALANNDEVFVSDALKSQVMWNTAGDVISGELSYWKNYMWFRQAVFDHKRQWLISSSPKTDLFIWNLKDFSLMHQWYAEAQGFGSTVEDMTIMGSDTLRTLTSDGILQDWDLRRL